MARNIFSFNIGKSYIKILEFSYSIRGIKVNSLKRIRVPDKEGWKEKASMAIKNLLSGKNLHNCEIICSIPGHYFFIRRYYFPFYNRNKLKEVIRFEMDGDIPISIDDVVFDFISTGKREKDYEVTVFALPTSTLKEYLGIFPEEVAPVLVMPETVALSNLPPLKGMDNYCLIDANPDRVSMLAIMQGIVRGVRAFSSVGKKVQDVLDEILKTLKLWKDSNVVIERFYLSGDGIEGLDEDMISSRAEIKHELSVDTTSLKGFENQGPYISLLGLSYGFMKDTFNLIENEIEDKKKDILTRRMKVAIGAVLVISILGLGDIYIRYHFLNSRIKSIDREIEKTSRQFLPEVKKLVNPRFQLELALKREEKKLKALKGEGLIDIDPNIYIDQLYREAGKLGISLIKLSLEGRDIIFVCETSQPELVKTFISRLRSSDNVKDIIVINMEKGLKTTRFKAKLLIS